MPDYVIKIKAPDEVYAVPDLHKLEDLVYDYITKGYDDLAAANVDVHADYN